MKEAEDNSSYKQIFKATSIFGGVQFINIIIQIIRSKLIAVLLGPSGMGIMGLLNSTISLISSLTNFGLGTSAVKNVSSANATGDQHKISTIITVLRRWVWITGLLGAIITLVSSAWLSQLTFGNKEYTLAFIWLSITLMFSQVTSGQLVILQGLRKLQYLAKANILGSIVGLLFSIPLYYYFRFDGIVPAIFLSGLTSMFLAWFYARKIKLESVSINKKVMLKEGKDMLRMGFMLSISGLITTGVGYLVRVYINNTGSIEDVGLYNAGFAIINTYVGLIFTAMSTDYYPRLSAIASNNKKANLLINQQAEIAILILSPILIFFLIFIQWIVIALFSYKFTAVNGMIHWAALGMYFKAASWSVGFILLAKGNSKMFFISELLANCYLLVLNIIGYRFWGLDGLGISFLIGYSILLFQVYLIAKRCYTFSFQLVLIKIFLIQFFIAISCFVIIKLNLGVISYIFGMITLIISSWISIKELDKRVGIVNLVKKYARKK